MSCLTCKHLLFNGCEAFDVIPIEFVSGQKIHDKPVKGQKNKIVFEQGMNEVLKYQIDTAKKLTKSEDKKKGSE